jgi:DNA-binding CsgD family transcriptional regulator
VVEKNIPSQAKYLEKVADLVKFFSSSKGEVSDLCKFLTLKTFSHADVFACYIMALSSDGYLNLLDTFGQTEEQTKHWQKIPLTIDVPGTEAIKEQKVIWLVDAPEFVDTYSDLSNYPGSITLKTLVHVPIFAKDNPVGLLGVMASEPILPTIENHAFLEAVASVISLYLSHTFKSLEEPTPTPDNSTYYLTRRQKKILQLISEGLTNAQIANEMGYSLSTVRHETMRIYQSLHASGRKKAIQIALEHNLIDLTSNSN